MKPMPACQKMLKSELPKVTK